MNTRGHFPRKKKTTKKKMEQRREKTNNINPGSPAISQQVLAFIET